MGEKYPDVRWDKYHIDILCAHFVQHPDWFDVVVASNLFGDILSDLGPACTGTIGIAPSANLNPERKFPSLFEPVHGSAPDIYGKGIANPIGQIWSGALMLDFLGYPDASAAVVKAIETVLAEGPRTRDMKGTASTADVAARLPRWSRRAEASRWLGSQTSPWTIPFFSPSSAPVGGGRADRFARKLFRVLRSRTQRHNQHLWPFVRIWRDRSGVICGFRAFGRSQPVTPLAQGYDAATRKFI